MVEEMSTQLKSLEVYRGGAGGSGGEGGGASGGGGGGGAQSPHMYAGSSTGAPDSCSGVRKRL